MSFYQWNHLDFSIVGVAIGAVMSGGAILDELYFMQWDTNKVILLGFKICLFFGATIVVLSLLTTPYNAAFFLVLSLCFLTGCGLIGTSSTTQAMLRSYAFPGIGSSLLGFIKILLCSLSVFIGGFMPENPWGVGLFFLGLTCLGFIKMYYVYKNGKMR